MESARHTDNEVNKDKLKGYHITINLQSDKLMMQPKPEVWPQM